MRRLFRNDHRGDSPSPCGHVYQDLGADRHVSFSAASRFVVDLTEDLTERLRHRERAVPGEHFVQSRTE